MKRPVIHNRFLPEWLHRVFAGIFGGAVFVTSSVLLLSEFGTEQWLAPVASYLLWSTPAVVVVCFIVAPRFSVVRGLAGDVGYDELHAVQQGAPADAATRRR